MHPTIIAVVTDNRSLTTVIRSLIIKPFVIVVTGRPRSGKTTLAHTLATRIHCPALCRDEFKEGYVHTMGGSHASLGRRYNPFGKHMLHISRKAAFLSCQHSQPSFGRQGTFSLELVSQTPMAIPNVFERLALVNNPVAIGGDVGHTPSIPNTPSMSIGSGSSGVETPWLPRAVEPIMNLDKVLL